MSEPERTADVSKAANSYHDEIVKPSQTGGDEALKILGDHVEAISEEEAAAVLKKIDWRLIPLMCIINALQLIDKNTLGNAATYGLIEQANLQGAEYSMLVTLFYIGYLVAEYPANYLMQKFPTGKFLTVNVTLWGAVLAASGAATNFKGLATCRFFLGVFEAPINPGLIVITSTYWTTKEQPRRIGFWYSAVSILNMIKTMAIYGIAHMDVGGMYPYQWMFLLFGLFTVLVGISLWWLLPDSPTTAKFLSERERIVAVQRIQTNQTGVKNREHKRYQVWEALKDPRVWMLTFGTFFQNMTNTLQNSFNGLIIKGLGYNTYQAVLLTMPGNAVSFVTVLTVTWFLGTRWGQNMRHFAIMLCYLPGLISTALLYAIPVKSSTTGVLLFAVIFLNTIGTCAGVMYSIVSANIAGYTKKSVVHSLFFVGYSLGNIISPQAFLQSESPRYTTGVGVTLASFCANIILFFSLYNIYKTSNKRRDKEEEERPALSEDEQMRLAFSDLTDRENRTKRYAL